MYRDLDRRAQATGIAIFLLALAVGALLWGILDVPAGIIFDSVSQRATDQQAQDVIDQREKIWERILFVIVLLSGVFLLARAILQSRKGGV
jgi:hypothetical protein